jgi:hypothetical protein
MLKVFRVFISETQGFHHDIEAESAYAAKQKLRASFNRDDRSEDIQPAEDSSSYTVRFQTKVT